MRSFTKALASKNILTPHISAYLDRGHLPDVWSLDIRPNKPKDDAFHPSSDCVPCVRELYARHGGLMEERKLDSSSQKIFMVGHFWHVWLQNVICDLGFCTWEDVEKDCGYTAKTWWAKGSADIAPCRIPGKGHYLIDFKTMNSRYFLLDDDEGPLADNLLKWRYQVNCYMEWTGLEKCIVLGIQKDSPHNFREFVFDYEPGLLNPVYEKWDAVTLALRTGQIPECDCDECPVEHMFV